MDQQDSNASNRPTLKLKTSKNSDITDKVNLQLKSTTKNSNAKKTLEQDGDENGNTAIKADTDAAQSSAEIKTAANPQNASQMQDNSSSDQANTQEQQKKKHRMEPKLYYKTLKYLCQKYPNCFKRKPDYPIPLAIRIHKQLQVQEEGNLSHTRHLSY